MNLPALLLTSALAAQSAAASPGDLAMARGDFNAAFAAYAAAVAAAPNDPAAALGLGTIDLYRNDLAGARTYLTRAAHLDPANPLVQARLRTLAEREPNASDFQIASKALRPTSHSSRPTRCRFCTPA